MAEKLDRLTPEGEEEQTSASRSNTQDDNTEFSLSEDSRNEPKPAVYDWPTCLMKFLGLNSLEDNEEEENLSEGVAGLNVSEDKEITHQNIAPRLRLFTVLVNDVIPITTINKDKPKVLIIHSKSDTTDAEDLSKNLQDHKSYVCRAVTLSQIEHIIIMRPYDFKKAAFDWADIIIVIIDDDWLEDIESFDSSEQRPQSSLDRKYEFTILQNTFVSKASMNLKLLPVIKKETSTRYRRTIELGDPLDINNIDHLAMTVTKLFDAAKKQEALVKIVYKKS